MKCNASLISSNHPDASTSAGECIDGLNLTSANAKCDELSTCTGFWLYNNGRFCPKATFSNSMTTIIANGGFYTCNSNSSNNNCAGPSPSKISCPMGTHSNLTGAINKATCSN